MSFSSYKFLFYRIGRERTRTKRCVAISRGSYSGLTFLRDLISCFVVDVIFTCVEIRGDFRNLLHFFLFSAVVTIVTIFFSQILRIRLSLQGRQRSWRICSQGRSPLMLHVPRQPCLPKVNPTPMSPMIISLWSI